MALPANVGFGTVTGRFIDSNGASIEGSVMFTPSPKRLQNASAEPTPVTILPKPVTVDLDGGAFTQALVATDDEDNNPHGWTYRVDFKFTGASADSFSIEVPEGATVDLTTVAPVSSGNGATIIRGEGVPAWDDAEDGQVVVLVDGQPAWGTAPGGGEGGGPVAWGDVTGKPTTFPPATHNHDDRYYTESEVDALIEGVEGGGGDVASVNGQTGTVVLDAEDVGARPDDWTPDLSGYATTSALSSGLSGKADTSHTHTIANVTGLQTALDGKQASGSYAAASHNHTAADVNAGTFDAARIPTLAQSKVTNLESDLAGKAATSHNHAAGDINSGTLGVARIPAGSTLSVVYNGSSWPSRPTARTDVIVQWLDFTGSAPVPGDGIENLDIVIQDAGV